MSEAQAEKAVQRLYESEGLRSELTDDEANVLLGWGEAQIAELAARGLEDAEFDALFGSLTKLIAHVNQFTGKREGMPADAQYAALAQMVALAQSVHLKIAPAEAEAYVRQHQVLSNIEAIEALIALIKPPTENI